MNKLSVVIVTLNEQHNLPNLLDDLVVQINRDFEVIVVDSNSDDDTVKIAHTYNDKIEKLKIIEMSTRGLSLGRNTGAIHANFERLLFLDADSRIDPIFIEKSHRLLDAKNIDIAAVYVKSSVDSFNGHNAARSINIGIWFTQFFFATGVGACIISTKTAHNLINGFDQSIPMGEDCDYTLRAFKHKQIKFGILPLKFTFDMRRYEEEGYIRLTVRYAFLNLRRFFIGEYKTGEIKYIFGEHKLPLDK